MPSRLGVQDWRALSARPWGTPAYIFSVAVLTSFDDWRPPRHLRLRRCVRRRMVRFWHQPSLNIQHGATRVLISVWSWSTLHYCSSSFARISKKVPTAFWHPGIACKLHYALGLKLGILHDSHGPLAAPARWPSRDVFVPQAVEPSNTKAALHLLFILFSW